MIFKLTAITDTDGLPDGWYNVCHFVNHKAVYQLKFFNGWGFLKMSPRNPYTHYLRPLPDSIAVTRDEAKAFAKRPVIKDFFPEGTEVDDVARTYKASPYLFKYAQALDDYIDSILTP